MSRSKGNLEQWEGRYRGGQFVRISGDMMNSVAWHKLTTQAKTLYLSMKTKYKGLANGTKFSFTYKEALEKLRFSNQTFKRAKDCLIENGFIEVVENNRNLKRKNIYKFSAKWIEKGFRKWRDDKPDGYESYMKEV